MNNNRNHRRLTLHAKERVVERLSDAGYDEATIDKIAEAIDALAGRFNVSTALKVLDLEEMVGRAWTDRSNGDQVWAIYRGGKAQTVFLRRHTQPSTPEAFGVAQVITLAEIA